MFREKTSLLQELYEAHFECLTGRYMIYNAHSARKG
jgi:hypothetical protein